MTVRRRKVEYNERREIAHRIDRLDRSVREKQINKAKAFKDINIADTKLANRLKMLEQKKSRTEKEIRKAKLQKAELAKTRKALGFEHETVVTEHAMLRYVERYMGVDMEEVYRGILKLPKTDVIKYGNTIVTVYPEADERITEDEA